MRLGYTLVELLVTIAIVGVVAGLLLPAVQQARESARSIGCRSNLRQMGMAVQTYHDVCGGLPYQGTFVPGNSFSGYSVHTRLLPFVEQNNIHRQIRYDVGFASQPEIARMRIPLYRCPSDSNLRTRMDGGIEFYPTKCHEGLTTGRRFVVIENGHATGGVKASLECANYMEFQNTFFVPSLVNESIC